MLADPESDYAIIAETRPIRYLSFRVGSGEYGLDIMAIEEIRNVEPMSLLPNTPKCILGAIHLRGALVPVVDMRLLFGVADCTVGELTVVVIVNIGDSAVGLLVDRVCNIVRLTPPEIRPMPVTDDTPRSDNVIGLATAGGHVVVLLDAIALLSGVVGVEVVGLSHKSLI